MNLQIPVVQEPENRRIKWATALSALLHLLALLGFGALALDSTNVDTVSELRVHLDFEDGQDIERDNAPAVALSARPSEELHEELPAAAAENPNSPGAPLPSAVATTAEPAPGAVADGTRAPENPAPVENVAVESSPAEDIALLATTGISDREVPALQDTVQRDAHVASIPAPQPSKLVRRVTEWTQGLRDTDQPQTELTWEEDGRQYTAALTRQPAADSQGIERVSVEITTADKGKRFRTRLQMKRLAFSHFTQLVDRWDSEVQFHADEIAGRFHSNSQIALGYDSKVAPRFLGKVTTAARGFAIGNSSGRLSRASIFRAGLETRAGKIVLPERFLPFSSADGAGNTEVRTFTRDTRLTFYSDGTCGWQTLGSNAHEQRQEPTAAPLYIVGAPNSSLYIRGTVRGTVLVYSPERIVVEGNLVYASDPRSNAEASDYLGLVSDRYIEVAGPKVTGPGDLFIDAAVYARRRFSVTDTDERHRATLFIFGSLTAGSLSATEPRYATKVEFDPRFETLRPPGFPMTNRYEIEAWDAQWQRIEDDRAE